jgi:hypothetical protein
MATYFARKAGTINAADVWATTPSGTAAAVTFAAGDVLMANSFAITVNVSTNLGASGEVRNDTTGGATASGSFTLSNGVTLTANLFAGSGTGSALVIFASAGTANIVGNCTAGGSAGACAIQNNSTGTINITGNCTGGTNNVTHGAFNNSTGTINITGNCTGAAAGLTSHGVRNAGAGTVSITGNCLGGGAAGNFGASNDSTGTLIIDGVIQASEFAAGVGGASRQQVTLLTGPFLISPTFGVNPIGCTAWRWATALNNQTYLEVPTQTLLQKRNLVTPDNATNFPAASNVRSGTAYGIGGVLTGNCIVPNPAQVAAGSPVDNTVGTLASATAGEIATAVATAVRTELATELGRLDAAVSSRLAPSGTLATVTNLTNAPASVTPSDIWSHSSRTLTSASGPTVVQIREEMDSNSTKLANLDASVSSRLAPGGTLATVTTLTNAPTVPSAASIRAEIDSNSTQLAAIKAKTDALPIERLQNCATTAIVGNLIAQANS